MRAVIREDGRVVELARNGSDLSRFKDGFSILDNVRIPSEFTDESSTLDLLNADGMLIYDPIPIPISKLENNIDVITGNNISSAVHPVCGTSEERGILRDQITRMLNGDMTASDDFVRLNKIAIEEIEKAQIEKEALDG